MPINPISLTGPTRNRFPFWPVQKLLQGDLPPAINWVQDQQIDLKFVNRNINFVNGEPLPNNKKSWVQSQQQFKKKNYNTYINYDSYKSSLISWVDNQKFYQTKKINQFFNTDINLPLTIIPWVQTQQELTKKSNNIYINNENVYSFSLIPWIQEQNLNRSASRPNYFINYTEFTSIFSNFWVENQQFFKKSQNNSYINYEILPPLPFVIPYDYYLGKGGGPECEEEWVDEYVHCHYPEEINELIADELEINDTDINFKFNRKKLTKNQQLKLEKTLELKNLLTSNESLETTILFFTYKSTKLLEYINESLAVGTKSALISYKIAKLIHEIKKL